MNFAHVERADKILRSLELKSGQFFIGGSTGLALRGIRDFGDIDIGVTTRYWIELLRRGDWSVWSTDPDGPIRCDPPYLMKHIGSTEINVFHSWRRREASETEYNDFNLVFHDGIEEVYDWPCIKLSILLRQKIDAVMKEPARPKDVADLKLITDYMGGVYA